MPQENVVEIIGKAIIDKGFRDELFANPGDVLAGYDLTEQERTELSNLGREAFDAFASSLDERVSKASLLANFANHPELIATAASLGRSP
jgi:hypothetical protein